MANNLGACYDRLGEVANAERLFRAAIEWHAEAVPVAYTNLALVLLRRRQARDAKEILNHALSMFPSNPVARHLLAAALEEDGDIPNAIANLQRIVHDGHATPETYGYLSALLADHQLGFDEAISVLRKGIGRYPKAVTLKNSLAYTYLMNGQTENARRILAELTPTGRDAIYVAATNGLLKLADHDFEGGRAGYEEAALLARQQGNERLARLAVQKMHLELARAYIRERWYAMAKKEIEAGIDLEELNKHYFRELLDLKELVSLSEGA